MRKKFVAIYALAGALVASPVFTSCVDDTVSESVEALRDAKTDLLKSEAAYNNAMAQAETIKANAEAAYNNAMAAYNNANAAYKQAQTEWEKAQKEYDLAIQQELDKIALEEKAAALEETKIALEATKRAEEIAKANAEIALEKAKLEAQNALLAAQQTNLQNQANFEKVVEGLANESKAKASYINRNVKAIMKGGSYYMLNSYGNWNSSRYYESSYYKSNEYTSIEGLIQGIADAKNNLLKLQNDLIDIEEYLAEKKASNEEIIATKTALIAKYKELQATSNREDFEKLYEEAKTNAEALSTAVLEKAAEQLTAQNAYNKHYNLMMEDPIQKLVNVNNKYLSAIEVEEALKDTIVSEGGITRVIEYTLDAVYEHSAEDAEELAEAIAGQEKLIADQEEAIANQEKAIADAEAELGKVNITEWQRRAAVAKKEADDLLKKYEDIKASEAYKTYIAKLEKAVADAQAAFDKNPTSFEDYKLDENGNVLYDQTTGQPIMVYGTKELLQQAESDLANAESNYNYGTEAEPAWLSSLSYQLYYEWIYEYGVSGLIAKAECLANLVEGDAETESNRIETEMKSYLENLKEDLETLNEGLEDLKELQAMLAAESDEMKAYNALCEERAELQKAIFALSTEVDQMNINKEYWNTLMGQLDGYIGEYGTLPNYEVLIADAEQAIKDAEEENANLETTASEIKIMVENSTQHHEYYFVREPQFDANGDIMRDADGNILWNEYQSGSSSWGSGSSYITTIEGVSKAAKETEIAKKEAEIAAMEAELVIRQAEYDAEVAALKALATSAE